MGRVKNWDKLKTPCSQPGAHRGAQPGGGSNQVAPDSSARRSIPTGVRHMSCGWAQWSRQGWTTELWSRLSGNWYSKQRNKDKGPGHLPSPSQSLLLLTFPELAASPRRRCRSECWIAEHFIYKHKNRSYRNIFSLNYRHILWLTWGSGGDTEGMLQRFTSDCYWESIATNQEAKFPKLKLSPHIPETLPEASGCRKEHWILTDMESCHPTHSPA